MAQPKLRFRRENGTEFPEWEKSRIADLFDISAGGDIIKENSSKDYSEEYPYAVYANALTNNGLYGYANYYKVEGDCFTVTGRGDVGYAVARHEKFVPIVRLLVCIPKHSENVDCFVEIVNNTKILVESTGVPQLTSIQLGHILIYHPTSLEEQQKIADILSTINEVIAQSEAEVQNLEQQKKAAMQKIFSHEVRFRREDGTEFPGWVTKRFLDISVPFNKRNKECLNLEIYSINNQVGFIPQEEQFEDAGYLNDTDTSIYMIVPPHHFAYNPARINVGSIGYQNVGYDVQVSSLYEVFATTGECDDGFVWHWFHTPLFNKMVMKYGEGGVRVYYYYDKLCETPIMLPCLEEQQKIADFLSTYDEAIGYAKQELAKWKELKKGLLQQMFL